MIILGFVEGAAAGKGGLGLVGVPLILSSTAARGHTVALIVGGPPNPGRERFLVGNLGDALKRKEGKGTFGVVALRSWTKWAIAPEIVFRLRQSVRSADYVSLHSLYSFPVFAGYLMARLYRKPYGIWPHGVFAPVQRGISSRIKWFYDKLIAKRILNHASVIFYSARGERREAEALNLKARSVIVPDGMDAMEFASLPPTGLFWNRFFPGHRGKLVLFLARLNEKKGLDLLVQAMARVVGRMPETRLAIVGPADPASFEGRVRMWIKERALDGHVAVTGLVSHSVKLEALADADVYVLPSQAENFGHSIFEAMASGVPVVVSDTINYAEEIAQSAAGLSVARRAEDFAEAILSLLENAQLRQAMGANGIRLARRYSWEETGAKVERVVESIVHNRPVPLDLTE